jgi:hypothetical protein
MQKKFKNKFIGKWNKIKKPKYVLWGRKKK